MHASARLTSAVRWNRSCRRPASNVAAVLKSRAVLEISGVDAKALLQGLMTNDISLLDKDERRLPCISTAFLNPKGRVLGDALVTRSPRHKAKGKPGYLLDCPSSIVEGLKTHLKLYNLRSKVRIKDASTLYDVLVSGMPDPWRANEGKGEEGLSTSRVSAEGKFADPRCAALGVRMIRPKSEGDQGGVAWPHGDALVPESRYDALRIFNGVGEGSELLDSIPLESNLDLLGSISFTKGCYVGQELTARTQFKGFVRKRVLPVMFPATGVQMPSCPSMDNVVDAGNGEGALLRKWGSEGPAVALPGAGSKVVDRDAEDEKLGAVIAVSPEYNVGLALLRLGKVMSAASGETDLGQSDSESAGFTVEGRSGTVNPAVNCHVVHVSGGGEESQRCLPLTPPWWPVDLDPATGKVSS